MSWLDEAITNLMLVGAMDGSHMQRLDAHTTSTAYILMYTSSQQRIEGWNAETSMDANTY